MSEVDVIVVDLDGGEMLLECLGSLAQQTVPPRRVIVVDNGSVVPASQRVGSAGVELVHVRLETNRGFTGGVNAAMPHVESELVALVNNDVILDRIWIERLAIEMQRNVRLAAVQSWIVGAPGVVDGAGISIEGGRFQQRGHLRRTYSTESWPAFWGVSATAALYRTAALRECAIDGAILDDRLFAYYEDVELSARLREHGWELSVIDEPLAVHRGSATRGRLGSRAAYLQTRNRHLVAKWHKGVGSRRSLFLEDLHEIAANLKRLEIGNAIARVRGLLAALGSRWRRLPS